MTNPNQAFGHYRESTAKYRPEWLRIPAAIEIFGLGRSSIYSLIHDGLIKSACVRRRGNLRGVRLISYDSLAAYVESMAAPTAVDKE